MPRLESSFGKRRGKPPGVAIFAREQGSGGVAHWFYHPERGVEVGYEDGAKERYLPRDIMAFAQLNEENTLSPQVVVINGKGEKRGFFILARRYSDDGHKILKRVNLGKEGINGVKGHEIVFSENGGSWAFLLNKSAEDHAYNVLVVNGKQVKEFAGIIPDGIRQVSESQVEFNGDIEPVSLTPKQDD